MFEKLRLYADFNNADPMGRVRLNCQGTFDDLARAGLELKEGLEVTLYDEELEAEGRVSFSVEEGIWVAAVDWHQVREA